MGPLGHNLLALMLTGLVFHLVFIMSVFDCYFTSPVVTGMQRFHLPNAESRRLVLIVADGLRADLLYNMNPFPAIKDAPEVIAPYLRSIVEARGAFGVSHTRVPTESRPGHVALIGGMYEDVSAVTKGWKTNPVDFDSTFNQSRHTFSFGSPDILPMFARGATPGKVRTWSYNEEDEDFTKDATALDTWVLDELQTLFRNATTDSTLDAHLRSDQVVFFLHLLGLDTTGHSYRPHSKEYMNNIMVVDDIVRQTEAIFSEFFGDEETSFIFTADHGMSVIGNHGDGDPDNTRTPLIAWGRGVRGPLPDSFPSSHDSYSDPWRLQHLLRRDVEQADTAALMAALIGTNWPVNSVGVVPDVEPSRPGYLLPKGGNETRAHVAMVNAKVIIEHYRVKHELKQQHSLFYKPFAELEGISEAGLARSTRMAEIESLIQASDWFGARMQSAALIRSGLAGLRYLQTYDRLLIRSIVTASYTGWAAYASLFIFQFQSHTSPKGASSKNTVINLIAGTILAALWTLFAVQRSPWTFYLYAAFPCYFWHVFISQTMGPLKDWIKTKRSSSSYIVKLVFHCTLVIAVLQGMVAAYTYRPIWSFGLVTIGTLWPIFYWPREVFKRNLLLVFCWAVACVTMAIFPLLGVDKKESLLVILLGGCSIFLTGVIVMASILWRVHDARASWQLRTSLTIQVFFILLSMVISASSITSLQRKSGLPLVNQVSGWIILVLLWVTAHARFAVSASLFPAWYQITHPMPLSKMLMFFMSFGPCFVFLSISVEGLFYVVYSLTLILWIEVESVSRSGLDGPVTRRAKGYEFQRDDLRIALFFLFFVQIAFFGTGNVASISSFYLEPVYRLVPIFNPFLMASLLIFKIVAPYVMLSVAFATLNYRLNLPPFSLFLVALILTDVMTMTFFFDVTDTGSWLEIGQSISFFCITSLLLVWSAGICVAGEYLMADTLTTIPVDKSKRDD